jgi:hypothetical protein
VLAWWIGAYALFFGTTMLVLAAKLRRWLRAFRNPYDRRMAGAGA